MSTLSGMFPFLKKLIADAGYQGSKFAGALATALPHVEVEIVKRSHHARGFVLLPIRWIVERTIAWLNRCRRLAKDWENLNLSALSFLRFASELWRKVGDGADQAAFLICCTASIPSLNMTP